MTVRLHWSTVPWPPSLTCSLTSFRRIFFILAKAHSFRSDIGVVCWAILENKTHQINCYSNSNSNSFPLHSIVPSPAPHSLTHFPSFPPSLALSDTLQLCRICFHFGAVRSLFSLLQHHGLWMTVETKKHSKYVIILILTPIPLLPKILTLLLWMLVYFSIFSIWRCLDDTTKKQFGYVRCTECIRSQSRVRRVLLFLSFFNY